MVNNAILVLLGTASLCAAYAVPQLSSPQPAFQPGPLPRMQVGPLPSDNDATVNANDTSYWTPIDDPIVDATLETGQISIGNYRVGRELPQAMITSGLVTSETILYEKQYPPNGQIFPGGIEFSFVARYTHRFWIDPNTNVKITWLDTDNVITLLNNAVFQTSAHKELLFDIRRDGVKIGYGGITDSRKPQAGIFQIS